MTPVAGFPTAWFVACLVTLVTGIILAGTLRLALWGIAGRRR